MSRYMTFYMPRFEHFLKKWLLKFGIFFKERYGLGAGVVYIIDILTYAPCELFINPYLRLFKLTPVDNVPLHIRIEFLEKWARPRYNFRAGGITLDTFLVLCLVLYYYTLVDCFCYQPCLMSFEYSLLEPLYIVPLLVVSILILIRSIWNHFYLMSALKEILVDYDQPFFSALVQTSLFMWVVDIFVFLVVATLTIPFGISFLEWYYYR